MRTERIRDLSKILFLDIETVPATARWQDLDERTAKLFADKTRWEQERQEKSAEELYSERAGIFAEFGRIICIGVGSLHGERGQWNLRVTSFQDENEYDLLLHFTEVLNRHFDTDEHWLCGHNGKEFDFPWIARRCIVNRVPLPRLLDIGGLKPWEVGHLDTMAMWSFGDRKNFTSLALLTHLLGIPTPKDDITGADVAKVYYQEGGLDRITAYCRKDVVATVQLFLRLRGEEPIPVDRISMV